MSSRPWHSLGSICLILMLICAICSARVPTAHAAGSVSSIVVSLAGYNTGDYKVAYAIANDRLSDQTYQVYNGSTQIAGGVMRYEGLTWGKYVYAIDWSSVRQAGSSFTIRSNGVSSYTFPVQDNIWAQYQDEMTAFYRVQRASVATSDALPNGYTDTPLSSKAYHPAGHLDDAASADRTRHYDLTGGWYDAGDYGKYGGNQWVGGEIALAYLRHAGSPQAAYDRDGNGVPDLLDEAKFGAQYAIKFVDTFGGAFYNINNNAGFVHPEKSTDNISGTSDDRTLGELSVGGSAKASGMLAATSRAFKRANIDLTFADTARARAITAYNYAYANQTGNEGSYQTRGGIANSLLWAEVELYLLTNDQTYYNRAVSRINALTPGDLSSTNYWDLRPMSLAEFYPVADATLKPKIQSLLKSRINYFMSTADDTPYGVLDEFSDFGVNEPHVSYLGDLLRYYELFGDANVLQAAKKGLYWVFGANPWNISWVSGIGANSVKYLHTRLDEQAYDQVNAGMVLPGAMVSGPNIKDPKDKRSISPWYQDRPLWQDDTQQWRYNEYSISIQVGLLYSITTLATLTTTPAASGAAMTRAPVSSPQIGDYVTGDVTVFDQPMGDVKNVQINGQTMTEHNGVFSTVVNVDGDAPYTNKRVNVAANLSNGDTSSSETHFTVAPALPSPSTPLLYDDFGGRGTWGKDSWGWPNWYNQDGGSGSYAQQTVDGRSVGAFSQTPSSSSSQAKFEPWHDIVDVSGYRYMEVTVKNPGYTDLRARFYIEADGGYEVSGGYISIPSTWTTFRFDLNQFPGLNKSKVHLTLWLKTGTTSGTFYLDDVTYTNLSSGSQPRLAVTSVSPAGGDEHTTFQFNATYTDPNNEPPFAVQAVIDGVVHDMAAIDPSDTIYSDGKRYSFSTQLAPGDHRFTVRTTDTSSGVVVSGVQSGPSVSANLARGKPATAVSECGNTETATGAVDDTLMTKWCSGGVNGQYWWQVDLGAAYNLGSFIVRHAGAGGEDPNWNTRDFTIQLSTDGTTWTTAVNVTGNTSNVTTHTIAARQARYVRLNITKPTSNGNTAARIYEVEVYAKPNLALNKPTSSTTACAGNEASQGADDGSIASKWCSSATGGPVWWRVDLGATTSIGQVVIKHAGAGGEDPNWNTRDFTIQGSADGTTWTTLATVTGNTANVTASQFNVTNARYVRLNITKPTSTSDTAARIYEVEVR